MGASARCRSISIAAVVLLAIIGLSSVTRADQELTPEQEEALARLREEAALREADPAAQTLSPDQMEKIKQLQVEAEARKAATPPPTLNPGDILVAGRYAL